MDAGGISPPHHPPPYHPPLCINTSSLSSVPLTVLDHGSPRQGRYDGNNLTKEPVPAHPRVVRSPPRSSAPLAKELVPDPPQIIGAVTYSPHRCSSSIWMLVGMNTIARPHNEPYLRKVLDELDRQMCPEESSPLCGQVRVLVRTSGQSHAVFNQAQDHFANDTRFIFERGEATEGGRKVLQYENSTGPALQRRQLFQANGAVRAQTRDVVAILRSARDLVPKLGFKYYLFMEDDFLPCQNTFIGLHYLISRAAGLSLSSGHHWAALRASYGLNGIVVQAQDVGKVSQYLARGGATKPPDHLFFDWAMSTKRPVPILAFRHNLFFHLGKASVVGNSATRFIPACYDLLFDWLQPGERFDVNSCNHDAVSPCPPMTERVGHHASTSPKTRKPFACSVSRQDQPSLFASGRFQQCSGSSKSGGSSSFPASDHEGTAAASPSIALSKVDQARVVPIMAALGQNCFEACRLNLPAYAFKCVEGGLGALNSCESLQLHANCTSCGFSRGGDQPAIEPESSGTERWIQNGPTDRRPRGRCLVNRGTFGSCSESHQRTRRLCACLPVALPA